jgi:hypothetical protein
VLSVAVPGFNGGQGTTLLTSPAALAPGNGAVTGATVFDAVGQVATFIAGAPQTTGASTFYTASVVAGDTTSGFAKNYGANFNSDFNISTPGATLGATANTLKFYALTSTDTAGSSNASVAYNTLGTWSFSTAGLLSYATSAVPLPAPLALLLSGLGLLGFVARRKTSASADVFAGAAA